MLTLLTRGAGLYRPQTSLARLGGRLRNWGRLLVAKLQLEDLPSPAWASPSPPLPFTPPLVSGRGKLKTGHRAESCIPNAPALTAPDPHWP